MDDNTTPNTNRPMNNFETPRDTQSQPAYVPPMQPKKKTGKIILWVIIILVLLAGVGAGGWYLGQMNKNKEVERAKQEAQASHNDTDTINNNKNQDTNNRPAHEQAPPKTVTETTCNADELILEVKSSSDSGAGTIAYDLVLTNVGTRTCVLGGFPGVSLVNNNGNMIGSPAERAKNYEEKKLTLNPTNKVKATVSTSNSTNFPEGECKEGATKFRVYPPNDTGYLSAPAPVDSWCPGFMISPVLAM